jgi:hypothetical protein
MMVGVIWGMARTSCLLGGAPGYASGGDKTTATNGYLERSEKREIVLFNAGK